MSSKADLNSVFKYVQEKKLTRLVNNSAILINMFPMREQDFIGRQKNIPVQLSHEVGFTFLDDDVTSYNTSAGAAYKEITVTSTPVALRTQVSLSAVNSWKKQDKAVLNNMILRGTVMDKSIKKFAEIHYLHGRRSVGTVASTSNVDGTHTTITFTAATFAAAIYSGMEAAKVDMYDGSTQKNTNADCIITAVDTDNLAITISGNSSDITAIDSAGAGQKIYFKGNYGTGGYGLLYQLDLSGSLYGIDSSVYSLFKATEHTVSGALSMAQVLKGQAKAVGKAELDEDVILLCNPQTWENLNSDLSALAMIDPTKVSKGENGFASIKYHGQSGSIEVVAHPYCMPGEAVSFPKSAIRRVGASDFDFVKDDKSGGTWKALESSSGFQCVEQYDNTLLATMPAKCVLYKSIVNS